MADHPALTLSNTRQRNDFVLGLYKGALWIGVRFGEMWRPARLANESDKRYFK